MKSYHLFSHKNQQVLINIEAMQTQFIDTSTAALLQHLAGSATPDPDQRKKLKELQLTGGKRTTPPSSPPATNVPITNMALLLTQSCNLECTYCYRQTGSCRRDESLDEHTAFRSVDWLLHQSGPKKRVQISFFGGEPFLKFSLMQKIVVYAKKRALEKDKELLFSVTTNGTLLDEEKRAFIKEHDLHVMVSLDGPAEIHDRQRPFATGKGSHASIVRNCQKLLALMPETHAHAVLTQHSAPEEIRQYLLDLGFANISLTPASTSLFKTPESCFRNTERVLQAVEEDAENWLARMQTRDVASMQDMPAKSLLYHAMLVLLHGQKKRYACGAGRSLVGVSCTGDVYLCHRFVGSRNYRLGSVFDAKMDRTLFQQPVTDNPVCADCAARFYCGGGCKHDNVGACGSAFHPAEDMCRLKLREFEMGAYVVSSLSDADKAFLVAEKIVPPKPCPLDF